MRQSHSRWGVVVTMGVLMAILGGLAIASAAVTGLMSVIAVGACLGVAGIVEIVSALGSGEKRAKPLRLMGGLLSLTVGALWVLRPITALSALALLLALFLLANGLFHVITALLDRYPSWGWDLGYGLCALVLGVLALGNLRAAGLWMIGTLVGIEILLRGLALTAVGLYLRGHPQLSPEPAV
jgi:uncharacterized membrane protein HdeD (DUF308 family)